MGDTTLAEGIIVYQNENYYVMAGESCIVEGAIVYLVKNNWTAVIEAEEQMLPRVVDYADQLNEKMMEMRLNGYVFCFVPIISDAVQKAFDEAVATGEIPDLIEQIDFKKPH